jgi:hypothetical protein
VKKVVFITLIIMTVWTFAEARQSGGSGQVPPNHPPIPQLPDNHPQFNPPMPPGHPPLGQGDLEAPPAANPGDVQTLDAIIKAYYATISGARGEPRDWNRLRSLLLPEARFITTRILDVGNMPMSIPPEQYIEMNRSYFERGGYFEDEIHRKVDKFGNIAQVFSTYEARRDRAEPAPYSRGINSIQLLHDGSRWWFASIMWDHERPKSNEIPREYDRDE